MEKDKEVKNKVVQTYAEDMAKVIEDGKGDVIKKIIHSEEEHEAEKRNLSPESKKNKLFMFLGLFLILVAITTLLFLLSTKSVSTVPVEEQFTPLIFNDKSAFIEVAGLKKAEIAKVVLNKVNGTLVENGEVEGIYLTENKTLVALRKFLELIDGSFIPGDSNFVYDNFLMGVVKNNNQNTTESISPDAPILPYPTEPATAFQGNGFFILLKMRSTGDIFDSMRAWETKMFSDLHGFLGIDISSETKYLLTKEFENGIVENKNARILFDINNKIVIMYILADDSSVIITNTNESARIITLRLASSQIKK